MAPIAVTCSKPLKVGGAPCNGSWHGPSSFLWRWTPWSLEWSRCSTSWEARHCPYRWYDWFVSHGLWVLMDVLLFKNNESFFLDMVNLTSSKFTSLLCSFSQAPNLLPVSAVYIFRQSLHGNWYTPLPCLTHHACPWGVWTSSSVSSGTSWLSQHHGGGTCSSVPQTGPSCRKWWQEVCVASWSFLVVLVLLFLGSVAFWTNCCFTLLKAHFNKRNIYMYM